MIDKSLFESIMASFKPFGRERSLLEMLWKKAESLGECSIDRFGSLIVHRSGGGKRIMLAAQADVPSVLVTYVEADGAARFLMTGKSAMQLDEGTEVLVDGNNYTVAWDEDCTGAGDLQRMRILPGPAPLHVGDKGVLTAETLLTEKNLSGANGGIAAALLVLLEALTVAPEEADVYAVFSIGSEADLVSQRGIKCAAFHIQPQLGISLEALSTGKAAVSCGEGPVLLLSDEHAFLRRPMLRLCRRAAEESGAALQYAALSETSRETALHHYQCQGADAITLALPTEKIGTVEKINQQDLDSCVQIVAELMKLYLE